MKKLAIARTEQFISQTDAPSSEFETRNKHKQQLEKKSVVGDKRKETQNQLTDRNAGWRKNNQMEKRNTRVTEGTVKL